MLETLDGRVSIYQPEQQGLIFPEIPQFSSFEAERTYRKQHLVAAVRAFAMHGFDYGFAGHLTIRDPERPELYWTNPMCVHFSQVKMSNLILADHAGNVVQGSHAINRAGFVLHAAVHEAHPDIVAMCHAHTVYGTAWCATGRPLDMISQDAACFYNNHVVIGASAGAVAVERESGYSIASAFANARAALHQNHGLLTASRHSIDDAAFWFIALERCCQVQLLIEASGVKPRTLSQKNAEYSRQHVGNDFIGWLHFQTLYAQIAAQQPDMFD
ncbi:class II aldolase/adducin family protein [Acidiphilium sp. PA]|uniref:class II aldolase/adducin family protein n=1 Tax=Acidiphilium sp. PA TaxID=2871705 RepID=UPI0022441123|nr:class II aldolase/adducin family protein [Acidiphilium sp. PA]